MRNKKGKQSKDIMDGWMKDTKFTNLLFLKPERGRMVGSRGPAVGGVVAVIWRNAWRRKKKSNTSFKFLGTYDIDKVSAEVSSSRLMNWKTKFQTEPSSHVQYQTTQFLWRQIPTQKCWRQQIKLVGLQANGQKILIRILSGCRSLFTLEKPKGSRPIY